MRNLIVLLLVTAIFGVSLTLFGRVVGFSSPWFVLILMLSFLGVIAFARPLFLLRMPRSLRNVQRWEVEGKLYRALGVASFGSLLRRTSLRYLQPLVYLSRYPANPSAVYRQMEGAEAAHLWAAALILPYMVYAAFQHRWIVIVWFAVVQLIGNLYPMLHLRWVRGRLKRVLDRKLLANTISTSTVG